MQFTTFATVVAFFNTANALVTPLCVGRGYGTFYNDHNCREGGSQAFSMGNPGCVANQFGRNSLYVQNACGSSNPLPSMVWSPGSNCNCQNDCAKVPKKQGCWDLNGHKAASSFRFISGGCGGNNC